MQKPVIKGWFRASTYVLNTHIVLVQPRSVNGVRGTHGAVEVEAGHECEQQAGGGGGQGDEKGDGEPPEAGAPVERGRLLLLQILRPQPIMSLTDYSSASSGIG